MYAVAGDGTYVDMREDYELPDFGGVMPCVGDLIVEPGVAGGLDRRDLENRTVLDVVARYFYPRTDPKDEWGYIGVLVVRERPAKRHEEEIVTKR
ncbi:MAG: hypothetical protein F4Y01_03280 [Gammaproteobacteria bacterium]|nr:hypothetical protein [Gammaproteobacteria bacterium]